MQRFLTSRFLAGLAVAVPLGVTFGLLWYLLVAMDSWFQWLLPTNVRFPGCGLALALVLVAVIGVLASATMTKPHIESLEGFLLRVPGVKLLYGAIKDFSDAIVGKTHRFDKPVLVELGAGFDAGVIGFVTRDDLESFGLRDRVAVYFPQSYNFGGNMLILPRERVTALDIDSARAMAFVVSGGVADTDSKVAGSDSLHPRATRLRVGAARWNAR